jgi:hypothetical protein
MKCLKTRLGTADSAVVRGILVAMLTGVILFGTAANARADPIDYVVSQSRQFGTIDLQTGSFTPVGTADWDPSDMTGLPGDTIYGIDRSGRLLTIDPTNGSGTAVGTTGLGGAAIKIRQDGTLFGLTASGNLYTIDTSTAAPTLVGATGKSFYFFDMAFDSSNQLFAVDGDAGGGLSNLYGIDPTTAAIQLIGPVGFRVAALEFENGILYGYTDNAPRPIISIDTTTGLGNVVVNQDPSLGTVFGAAPATAPSANPEPAGLTLLGIGFVCLMGYPMGSAWWRRAGLLDTRSG